MSKTKDLPLADKIRRLKKGESFEIGGKKQRIHVCKIIAMLKEAGWLPLNVGTKETAPQSGKFKVFAL